MSDVQTPYEGGMEPIEERHRRDPRWHGRAWVVVRRYQWVFGVLGVALLAGVFVGLQQRTNDELDEVRQTTTQQGDAVEAAASDTEAIRDSVLDARSIAADAEDSVLTIVSDGGQGTAFALFRDGTDTIFVTNRHVIEGAGTGGSVSLGRTRAEYEGRVIARGENTDVALVRVDDSFPVLEMNGASADEGDPVLAYGSPLGLSDTRSVGIVSAMRDDFIQFDAAVNPGNSGGPLFDREGNVLGIVTGAISNTGSSATGLSLALSIEAACDLADATLDDVTGC